MSPYEGYELLLEHILTAKDREKFEKAVGTAISGGPRVNLVIQGPGGSGKSTLLDIVEKAVDRSRVRGVYIKHDGAASPRRGHYVFSATNTFVHEDLPNLVLITTTGRTIPNLPYREIMSAIREYPGLISLRCVDRYITLTRNYQEN
jgi:ABC-type nitrate/sulfonate/bicarbonate transport system ATPase subunit